MKRLTNVDNIIAMLTRITIMLSAAALFYVFVVNHYIRDTSTYVVDVVFVEEDNSEGNVQANYIQNQYDYRSMFVRGNKLCGETTLKICAPSDTYTSMNISLDYDGDPKELEFIVEDENGYKQEFPLHVKALNELEWYRKEEEGFSLYDRDDKFGGIDELLYLIKSIEIENIDDIVNKIFFYNIDLLSIEQMTEGGKEEVTIPVNLRGKHSAYIYKKEGKLNITFCKYDLNHYEGKDNMVVRLYKGDSKLGEYLIDDDGNESDNRKISKPIYFSKDIYGLGEGIYKIVFDANYDTYINDVRINACEIAFQDHLFLGGGHKPVSVCAGSGEFKFSTWHEESAQVIRINGARMPIRKKGEIYSWDGKVRNINKIDIAIPDLYIDSPGNVFSFEFNTLLGRQFLNIENRWEAIRDDDISAILARYTEPKRTEGGYRAEKSIDISRMDFSKGRIIIKIRSKCEEELQKPVILSRLRITLSKKMN